MDLVIVDCQNDFISGSLACTHAHEAVNNIAELINQKDVNVFYTADYHPKNHMSFKKEGGLWPDHCVAGTEGAEIHQQLKASDQPPTPENTFLKGRNADKEEYSGFKGENSQNVMLKDVVSNKVYVTGIASELCVKETAIALKKDGKEVIVLKDYLGYVDEQDHLDSLKELEAMGIMIE